MIWFVQDIQKKKRLTASIIHETIIQIGEQYFLTVVLLRTIYSSVLGNYIFEEKMLFAEKFIRYIVSQNSLI